jgi:hypothetical protein
MRHATASGRRMLIFRFVRLIVPHTECLSSLTAQKWHAGNATMVGNFGYLVVDERIAEAAARGIDAGIGIIDFDDMSPVDCAQAHGTRLAGSIEFTIVEVKSLELCTCLTYGHYFRMGCRIVRRRHTIHSRGNYLAVAHNDGTKGATSLFDTFFRKFYGFAHECFIHLCIFFIEDHKVSARRAEYKIKDEVFCFFIPEAQPNFNIVKVSARRAEYKIKDEVFCFFIPEAQPNFNIVKVSARRAEYKIKGEVFCFFIPWKEVLMMGFRTHILVEKAERRQHKT